MPDRELLELAAKAAGYNVRWHDIWKCFVHNEAHNIDNPPTPAGDRHVWVPLTDDGDALRLAVHLKLILEPSLCQCNDIDYDHYGASDLADPVQAMRAAIVQCAAEIGKGMK